MASNIVEILVKSRNETKEGFSGAKRDAELAGDEAGQGFMGKFGSWLVGGQSKWGGGGIGGIFSTLFSTGPVGISALGVVIGGALTELTGLIAGLTAAAAGAGAFGILAMPVFERVKNAYTAISTAQAAYNTALTKEHLDPTKTNAAAVAAALLNLKVAQTQAGPQTLGIINSIHLLGKEFSFLSNALQPTVLKVFGDGLGVIQTLMPALLPMAKDFGGAFDGLLGKLEKFASSPQFAAWLGKFDKMIGPATTAIGEGIGKVVIAFGKLLTVMSAHDVVHTLNIAFDALADTFKVITLSVKTSMIVWDELSSHIAAFSRAAQRDLANWAQDVDNAFKAAGRFLVRAETDLANWAQVVDNIVSNVINWFKNLPGNILKGVGNLGNLLYSAGRDVVSGLIRGVESMFGAVARTAGSLVSSLGHSVLHLLGIGSPSKVAQWWGQMVGQGLAGGLDDSHGVVGSAAQRLAAKTLAAPSGGFGGGLGASGGLQATLMLDGPPESVALLTALWPVLKVRISQVGGGGKNSVQVALGKTH